MQIFKNTFFKQIHFFILFLFIFSVFSNLTYAEKTVKLSPKLRVITDDSDPKNRIYKKLDSWRKKFVNLQILNAKQAKKTARVIANRKGKVISINNDQVYINKLDLVNYKKEMGVYRIGRPIKDEKAKKIIGYPFYYLSDASLKKYNVENDLSLVVLSNVDREVLTGDRVLNKDQFKNINIKKNTNKKIKGRIVAIVDGVKNADTGANIILDLGKKEHVRPGDLLTVSKSMSSKRSVQFHEDKFFTPDNYFNKKRDKNSAKYVDLPDEKLATILVYKVFDETSLALVVENIEPISITQKVTGYKKLEES